MPQVSNRIVQFNCLYRWHATTSKADEEWINQLMKESGLNPNRVSDNSLLQPLLELTLRTCHIDYRIAVQRQGERRQDEEHRDDGRQGSRHRPFSFDFYGVGFGYSSAITTTQTFCAQFEANERQVR